MIQGSNQHKEWAGESLHFVRQTTLSFILLSLVLAVKQWHVGVLSVPWLIHTGMLQDLAAELPTGRQALVSSLAAMPLSSLMALPFLPLLSPAGFGLAYLYGLALVLALSSVPLSSVLRRLGCVRTQAAAPFLLAGCAALLGSTEWSDGLACLAMLILAVYFEIQDRPELRALSGIFWALTFFAYWAGIFLVGLRLATMLLARLTGIVNRETRAVHWIQGVSILYVFSVYFFLNWMIMGSPVYPFATAAWRLPGRDTTECRRELAAALSKQYSDCRPIVSGLWGYTIQPLIVASDGYHFIDFKAGKLPSSESGSFVLVIPTAQNPLANMSDLGAEDVRTLMKGTALSAGVTEGDWFFARLEVNPEADPDVP
jgi:hypothetical protein